MVQIAQVLQISFIYYRFVFHQWVWCRHSSDTWYSSARPSFAGHFQMDWGNPSTKRHPSADLLPAKPCFSRCETPFSHGNIQSVVVAALNSTKKEASLPNSCPVK